MSRGEVIALVVAIVVVLALLALAALVLRSRSRKRGTVRRERAVALRDKAAGRATDVRRSQDAVVVAEEEAGVARAQAEQAEERAAEARRTATTARASQEDLVREADRIDPDIDHRAKGYQPRVPDSSTPTGPVLPISGPAPDPAPADGATGPIAPEDGAHRA